MHELARDADFERMLRMEGGRRGDELLREFLHHGASHQPLPNHDDARAGVRQRGTHLVRRLAQTHRKARDLNSLSG